MTVAQLLGSLGSWDLQLRDETPDDIIGQLGFFGHIAIADGFVDVGGAGDGLLTGSRYVGVLRAKDKDTGRKLSGSGMIFWLGDEDGKGDILENEVNLVSQTLAQCVTAIVGPSLPLNVGTVFSVAGTYTGKHQFQTRREALGIICDAFNVEYRVNGNGTVDVGTAAQLYNTQAPDTIIVRKGSGSDMDLVALGGDYKIEESVFDYSTRVVLLGQTIGTGDTPETVFATGSANAPTVPYLDLFGNPVKMVRTISESGTTSGSVAARAQLQLNRFNRVARSLKVTAEDFETEGNFVVGDNVYVYDPDTGIVNPANEVTFRGEVLHPDVVRASGITWPVVQGMTVAFRTQTGVWLDLTPFVTWETGGNELTVGDLPKSLTKSSDNPVQVRLDGARADASIPNAPTGLTLTTSSVLTAQGQTAAVIHASWTAPALNTDGSVITDLSHYVIQYRWTARAPLWQTTLTSDTDRDVAVSPGLPYEVRVAAVDLAGHMSAFTATSTITSAADAIAPNPPADPVVTNYLGQLRIEYAGTDSGGNPMASDTNRIDVHVGTTSSFTATAATRVDSINPFAKGVAYATAPYGATRYVRLIAVDHSGNSSASSAVVSGATAQVVSADVFDGAIGTAKLADLAVTTAKINLLAVNDAQIGNLSVGKLTAGTMAADVVMSGRFTTALTGARVEMNSLGFYKYDASGNQLVAIGPSSGALITGTYRTALTGRRLEMGTLSPSLSQIDFWAPDSSHTWIRAFTASDGREALQFGIGTINAFDDNTLSITDDSGGLGSFIARFSRIDLTAGASFNIFTAADSFGTQVVGIDAPTRTLTYRPGSVGKFIIANYNNTSVSFHVDPFNNTMYHYSAPGSGQFYFADGSMSFFTTSHGKFEVATHSWGNNSSPVLKLFTNDGFGCNLRLWNDSGGAWLELKQWDDALWYGMRAGAFTVMSDAAQKENVRALDAADPGKFLDLVRGTKVKRYMRRSQTNQDGTVTPAQEEIGLIAQEAPAQIVVPGTEKSIDLYQMISLLWVAVQELSNRTDEGKP